jgi:hypothetical protein
LVKTVLAKVPFSTVHYDVCGLILASQEECEKENLRIIVKREQLLTGDSDDDSE